MKRVYSVDGASAPFDVSAVELTGLADKVVRKRVNDEIAREADQLALTFYLRAAVDFIEIPPLKSFTSSYEPEMHRADARVLSILWVGNEDRASISPIRVLHSANFELAYGNRLGLEELFDGGQVPLETRKDVEAQLTRKFGTTSGGYARLPELMAARYTLAADGIEFNFEPGEYGARVDGPTTIAVSYDKIESSRLGPQGSLRVVG